MMTSHDTKSKSKFNLNILPLSNQLYLTRTTMLNINFKNESLARFISHPSHPLKIINITRKKNRLDRCCVHFREGSIPRPDESIEF